MSAARLATCSRLRTPSGPCNRSDAARKLITKYPQLRAPARHVHMSVSKLLQAKPDYSAGALAEQTRELQAQVVAFIRTVRAA